LKFPKGRELKPNRKKALDIIQGKSEGLLWNIDIVNKTVFSASASVRNAGQPTLNIG
jgi:hypothetical protein